MPLPPLSPMCPQESTGPQASAPAEQALESASLASPSAPEEEIPAHMQPLHIQLGVIKGSTDVRLRPAKRAHQSLTLPSVLTYERYIWEWGCCAPSVESLSSILIPSGTTRKVTLICKMGK